MRQRVRRSTLSIVLCAAAAAGAGTSAGGTHDFDANGYVGPVDYQFFAACLTLSGPGVRQAAKNW